MLRWENLHSWNRPYESKYALIPVISSEPGDQCRLNSCLFCRILLCQKHYNIKDLNRTPETVLIFIPGGSKVEPEKSRKDEGAPPKRKRPSLPRVLRAFPRAVRVADRGFKERFGRHLEKNTNFWTRRKNFWIFCWQRSWRNLICHWLKKNKLKGGGRGRGNFTVVTKG